MEITKQRVVYELPGMREAIVRRIQYRHEPRSLTMDVYLPQQPRERPMPAVVVVLGYADVGAPLVFGCQFREMGMYVAWAQLFAASGMAGVLYETSNPAEDVNAVLACLRDDSTELGIDANRIGLWSGSGNVPTALSVLMDGRVRCGALCYGFMLDLDGSTAVATAAGQYYFANPVAGKRIEDFPKNAPLFIAKAGQDQFAGVKESIDAFVAAALRFNLPLTVMNHPEGPHGFDFGDDSKASRSVIRAILAFFRDNLVASA